VSSQRDVNRVRRLPKNRKERKALIIPDYENAVREWIKIPLEARLSFRKRAISLLTRRASQKALQRDLTFHDLRHSYCIYLISKGASLSLVAQSIGDSIKVTERYYSGFSLTSESIELLKSQLANLSK
jgi:site-specific recombinase XerD